MGSNSTVYMMVGIPGSGKSTWIKNNLGDDIPVVSRDIIRSRMGHTKSADEKVQLSREQEKQVTENEQSLMEFYCKTGEDFVIDDTNTKKFFRKDIINLLRKHGAKIIAVKFNTPLEVCIKRREGQIPADVMQRIHDTSMDLDPSEYDEIIEVPYNEEEN